MANQESLFTPFGFPTVDNPFKNFNNSMINNKTSNNTNKERKYKLKNSSEVIRISGELKKEIEILGTLYKNLKNNMNSSFCKNIRSNGIKYTTYRAKAPSGSFAQFHNDDLSGVSDSDIITIATGKANYKSGLIKNFDLEDVKVFEKIKSDYKSYKTTYETNLEKIKSQITSLTESLNSYKNNNLSKAIDSLQTAATSAKDIVIERKKGNKQRISSRINEIKQNCNDYRDSITDIKI